MRALALALWCVWVSAALAADGGHAGHGQAGSGHEGHGPGLSAAWTDLPLIEAVPGRDRSSATFHLSQLSAGEVKAYAPGDQAPLPEGVRFKADRLEWEIPVRNGRFRLESTGVGNYHWLQAREETPESVKVASTAHFFSNPGPAPTAMLARPKTELEIVPTPLPREHNRYRAGEEWDFALRFRGQPLAGATLQWISDAGTRASFTSDAAGQARVRFPADVRPAAGQRAQHGRGAANRFVLAVEHTVDGRRYLTAFNGSYAENAFARRSLLWGSGFLVVGGLLGLPLIVRRKETRHA
ncbi:MAG: hypothetical protein JNM60_00300 [Candidatus Competibacteraceae bacterium]|nr:hypothetical protein [Candidatus Competibacteraceae bacterium]